MESWTFKGSGDVEIACLTHLTESPNHIIFTHATGFCKEMWNQVITNLKTSGCDWNMTCWDLRGHGDSGAPTTYQHIWIHSVDLYLLVEELKKRGRNQDAKFWAVGHSWGGATVIAASLFHADLFISSILIEPILIPPIPDLQFFHGIAKRKSKFPSLDDVKQKYLNSPNNMFVNWDPNTIDDYFQYCFKKHTSGEVELKCKPTYEAQMYSEAPHNAIWDASNFYKAGPIFMLYGENTIHYEKEWFIQLVDKLSKNGSKIKFDIVSDSDHWIPFAKPKFLASIITDHFMTSRSLIRSKL